LTGVQALALFTQLQHMTDHNPEAPEHLMESESRAIGWFLRQARCYIPCLCNKFDD
jgi:hypothetical protein